MTNSYSKRQSIWSSYWLKGLISSCSEAISSDDSELELFWQTCSQSIQSSDVIVDLCTGKGAVIKTLLDHLEEQEKKLPACYGIDFAFYNLEDNVGFKAYPDNVKLMLETSIDSIPLDDSSVTRFVSQFGLEYALTDGWYMEVARLLGKGGTINAVMHHDDSVLCSVAKEEVRQIESIIDELKFFDSVNELVGYFALLKNPANAKKLNANPKAMSLRAEYNKKAALLSSQIQDDSYNSILTSALDVFGRSFQVARTHGKKEAKRILSQYEQELEDSRFRSKELIDAALDKVQVQELISQLESYFELTAEISELKSNAQIVAWGINVKRL